MPQFLLLNGPPSSGKDTLARELISYVTFTHMKLSAPLKRMACAILNCDMRWLEENKDKPTKLLFKGNYNLPASEQYMTPRQLQIAISEQLLKPLFGEDVLGRWLWQEALTNGTKLAVVSDTGFEAEARRIIANAGAHNVLLVRLHRTGCTFDGDSRGYLPSGLCVTYDIHNDRDQYQLAMFGIKLLQRHFGVQLLKEPAWFRE